MPGLLPIDSLEKPELPYYRLVFLVEDEYGQQINGFTLDDGYGEVVAARLALKLQCLATALELDPS